MIYGVPLKRKSEFHNLDSSKSFLTSIHSHPCKNLKIQMVHKLSLNNS
jgi:hypothetical protein